MAKEKSIIGDEVNFRDARLQLLFSYYKAATKQLVTTLNSVSDFSRTRNIQTLKQIDTILEKLDDKTSDWFKKEVELYYKEFGKDTAEALAKDGFPVSLSFGRVDEQAIASLSDEVMAYYREAYSGAKRAAMKMLNEAARDQVQELLAVGRITGEARQKIANRIAGYLKEGFVALVDRGGRKWSLEAYANMLTRTMLVKTANEGTSARLRAFGEDLVQVSKHFGACPLCDPWGGEILTLTGKHPKYKSVDDARENGLFHPNCRHRLLPYHEKLAEVSAIWNPELQHYINL
jgi:hypothetical protein